MEKSAPREQSGIDARASEPATWRPPGRPGPRPDDYPQRARNGRAHAGRAAWLEMCRLAAFGASRPSHVKKKTTANAPVAILGGRAAACAWPRLSRTTTSQHWRRTARPACPTAAAAPRCRARRARSRRGLRTRNLRASPRQRAECMNRCSSSGSDKNAPTVNAGAIARRARRFEVPSSDHAFFFFSPSRNRSRYA